ncbi:tRNA (guanosine(37)-N1)-methyltransferase TrmD [Candidatus Dojkabacteria bacterium]|nr:tRNA (guanosine(37)-N1)-methyltransferase TrmD [Candidatus Dojkabacteria bacterium]
MIKFKIITPFPDFVSTIKDFSIIKNAINKKLVSIEVHDLRKWSLGNYKQIDDTPYGGGAGMVLMIEPIFNALNDLKSTDSHVVLTSAKGKKLDYQKSHELSEKKEIIIICGHYEGVDQRIEDNLVDESISIGDYILSGGELPAMTIVDVVTRLVPGVINADSLTEETDQKNKEYPHYTRPAKFKGWAVPEVLLSGNHEEIKKWRESQRKKT